MVTTGLGSVWQQRQPRAAPRHRNRQQLRASCVEGLEIWNEGFGFRVFRSAYGEKGLGILDSGFRKKEKGLGFRVLGLGIRDLGCGSRVWSGSLRRRCDGGDFGRGLEERGGEGGSEVGHDGDVREQEQQRHRAAHEQHQQRRPALRHASTSVRVAKTERWSRPSQSRQPGTRFSNPSNPLVLLRPLRFGQPSSFARSGPQCCLLHQS
jgi:hypothetical protein